MIIDPLSTISGAATSLYPDVPPPPPPKIRLPFCPPLLKARMEEHGIEFPPFAPLFDRIFVHPIDMGTQPDTTAGGIVLPNVVKQKVIAQVGVLIMAGPRAIEHLYSHGVSIGDIVITARMSPWERPYISKNKKPGRVLVLRSSEVVGSEDLLSKYESGELELLMDSDGHVTVGDRDPIEPPASDEGI